MNRRMKELPRYDIIRSSVGDYAKGFLCRDYEQCFQIVNHIAPEHLEIELPDPEQFLPRVVNAGAFSSVLYLRASGRLHGRSKPYTSHIRNRRLLFSSGRVRLHETQQRGNIQQEAFMKTAPKVQKFALAEGLQAHAAAMEVRYDQ